MVLYNLDTVPPAYDEHAWADYIEMLCLVDPDRFVSRADVADRIRERKDVGELTAEPGVDGDPVAAPEDLAREDFEEPELDDARAERLDGWFRHLVFRAGVVGEAYPFIVDAGGRSVERRAELTELQRLYVFLLLCSSLRYVRRHHPLTTGFEQLGLEGMRRMLPDGSDLYIFGKGGPVERYTGTLWEKMGQLADDLKSIRTAERRDFPDTDTGDGGLDLVGWVPHPDELPSRLVLFAQCACTENWVAKQATSGFTQWVNRIKFLAPPANMVFIPFLYRAADGRWHKEDTIRQSILIDRLRLLRLLTGSPAAVVPAGAVATVDGALATEEPVF
ncbi:MAG TPA: hypothetical protein VF710_26115 [Longimicrobium sp.]|jgi:hypothetical protein